MPVQGPPGRLINGVPTGITWFELFSFSFLTRLYKGVFIRVFLLIITLRW